MSLRRVLKSTDSRTHGFWVGIFIAFWMAEIFEGIFGASRFGLNLGAVAWLIQMIMLIAISYREFYLWQRIDSIQQLATRALHRSVTVT